MRKLALAIVALLVITVGSALAQIPVPTNRAGCETQTRTTVTSGIVGNISGASLRVLLLNCFSSFLTLSDTGQTIINPIFPGLNGPVIANGVSPITAGTISGNTQAFVTADVAPIAGQCPQFDASGGLVPIVCPTGGGSGGFTVGAAINGSCPNGQVVYSNSGIIECEAVPGTGTVTSVGATVVGGIISVSGSPITASGNIAITIAGTIGGVPYFTSGAAWASSATLAANAIMVGGGTGSAPSTITTGLNVLTALGVNIGSAGAPVLFNGAGGTPTSLTLTNATGLPNAGLLNSSVTLGSTAMSLGSTYGTIAGAITWTANPTYLGGAPELTFSGTTSSRTSAVGMTDGFNMFVTAPTAGNLVLSGAVITLNSSFEVNSSGTVTAGTWPTLVLNGSCLRLENYGASPGASGSTNASAWNSAVSALSTSNGCITIGPGTYTFSANLAITLAAHQNFGLYGSGKETTILYWPAGSGGIAISRNAQSRIDIRNFSETTGVAGGGTALNITDAGTCAGGASSSQIDNLLFRGNDGIGQTDYWNTEIVSTDLNLLNLTKSDFFSDSTNTHGTGVFLQGNATNSCLEVITNLAQDYFGGLEYGLVYGTWAQGVTVSQSNFNGGGYGIYAISGEADLDQLTVTQSQFNVNLNGIELDTAIPDTTISDDLFFVAPSNSGIDITACYGGQTITGDVFRNIPGQNALYGVAINCGGTSTAGVISGNASYGISGTLTTGVNLGSSATGWSVFGNSASSAGVTNGVANAGTGNFVGTSCATGLPSTSYASNNGIQTHC